VLCGGERFRRHLAQSTVAVATQHTTPAHNGADRADRLTISVHPPNDSPSSTAEEKSDDNAVDKSVGRAAGTVH
jgi:hypothetical protein